MLLPAWIDPESWKAFLTMRKTIKAPLTPYAETLIIRELVKLKSSGEDPQACLDQSIRLGYRDVWPVKDKQLRASTGADETAAYLEAQSARRAEAPPPEVAAKIASLIKRVV